MPLRKNFMKQIILFLFALIIQAITVAQQVKTIPVALTNFIGSEPFFTNRNFTLVSDSIGFKGIPTDLKEYKIKQLQLRPSDDQLFILYGLTTSNQRLVLFDSDFDKDFSKEKPYLFDNDIRYNKTKERAVIDTTSAVEIIYPGALPFFVKLDLFNCCVTYQQPVDSLWHLFVQTDYHREGAFSIGHQQFRLAVSASNSPYFNMERVNFLLVPEGQSFPKESYKNQPYKSKQSAIVNQQEFLFDSLSPFGDTAWIQYNGYIEKAQGSRENLFALNIQAKTIDNLSFSLTALKGKYVLLDFWGTWCNPCIALIPRIKKLNKTYKSKGLNIVSIAYDKKDAYGKLLKMLKEKRMNWTNLYDDQDSKWSITEQYDINCFPTSILINPSGKIIFRSCGEEDFSALEKRIFDALK